MDGLATSADLVVRSATDADAFAISFLLEDLGHPIEPARIVEKLAEIRDSPVDRVWVAGPHANAFPGEGQALAGVLSLHAIALLHRPGRLARITALVVHPKLRGKGIGRRLVEVAERRFRRPLLQRAASFMDHSDSIDARPRLAISGVTVRRKLPAGVLPHGPR